MSQEEFVVFLGTVFEGTPEIARLAWLLRPFKDLQDLHQKMMQIVNSLSEGEKLTLIKAHPDLGSKAKMAFASVQEQAGVGLDKLTPLEYESFHSLNQAYREKFSFPFIIAVKYHTKTTILKSFKIRLENSLEEEKRQAIAEIGKIAQVRLSNLALDFNLVN